MLRFGRRSFHWGNSPKDSPKDSVDPSTAGVLFAGGSSISGVGAGNVAHIPERATSTQQSAAGAGAAPVDVPDGKPPVDPAEASLSLTHQVHAAGADGVAKQGSQARGETGAAGLDEQSLSDTGSIRKGEGSRRAASEARMSVVISEDGPGPEGPEIGPIDVPEIAVLGSDTTALAAAVPKPTHVRRRSLQRVPSVSGGGSSGSFHARKLSIDDIGVGRVSSFQDDASLAESAGLSQRTASSNSRPHASNRSDPAGANEESTNLDSSSFPAGSEILAEAGDFSERSAEGGALSGNVSEGAVARQGSLAGSEGERKLVKAMSGGMDDRRVAWLDECIAVADGDVPGFDDGATALQRPGTLKTWKSIKGSRGRSRLFGSGECLLALLARSPLSDTGVCCALLGFSSDRPLLAFVAACLYCHVTGRSPVLAGCVEALFLHRSSSQARTRTTARTRVVTRSRTSEASGRRRSSRSRQKNVSTSCRCAFSYSAIAVSHRKCHC